MATPIQPNVATLTGDLSPALPPCPPAPSACLALPKLNLQFLTLHDYLLRNFNLFRLESTCE